MDLGVHMLDIALYLMDEPPVRAVTAATYAEFGPRGRGSSASPFMRKTGVQPGAFDVEDLSTAFLRLQGGGLCCWSPAGPSGSKDQCYVTLYGADGGASIEWGAPDDPQRSLNIWTEKAGVPATCIQTCRPTASTRNVSWTSSPRCGPVTTRTIAASRRWPARL